MNFNFSAWPSEFSGLVVSDLRPGVCIHFRFFPTLAATNQVAAFGEN